MCDGDKEAFYRLFSRIYAVLCRCMSQFLSKPAPPTNHAYAVTGCLRLLLYRNLYARVMHFEVLLFFVTGHGFKLSPVVGKLIAELVMGESPSHDLYPFRIARFMTPNASL